MQKTIRLASKRYHSLEGSLIDVREAFKQLREIGTQRVRIERILASTALQLGMIKQTN